MRQFGMIAGRARRGAGRRRLRRCRALDRFYQAYLVAYTFWMGVVARQPRAADGAAPVRRRLGHRLRRPFEAAVRTMPVDGGAVPADRVRHAPHLRVDAAERRAERSDASQQKALVPEHAVLPRPPGVLFRRLDRRSATLLTAWSAEQDRTGDPGAARQDGDAVRRRPADLRPDRDVRDGRLDDVGQPALVLDHLGHALRRRPGPVGVRLRHHRAGDAGADGAARRGARRRTTSTTSASCCSRS